MPIVFPERYEPDARTLAIIDVATMIEDAMIGDEPVSPCEIAENIVDYLRPRSAVSMDAIREWQERHRAEQLAEVDAKLDATFRALRQKPCLRARAATQREAE